VTETELVCWGDVEVGAGSVIGACMKVRGNMYVGANVTFLGSVVVNGNISTGENCVFLFDVVSKGEVLFGKGTRLGSSTNELMIPAAHKRLVDQQEVAVGSLSDVQYEMHYG
jgi:UDP-3-O-[3-hydroxymyristoyl] glucosamine N-acyltransferase